MMREDCKWDGFVMRGALIFMIVFSSRAVGDPLSAKSPEIAFTSSLKISFISYGEDENGSVVQWRVRPHAPLRLMVGWHVSVGWHASLGGKVLDYGAHMSRDLVQSEITLRMRVQDKSDGVTFSIEQFDEETDSYPSICLFNHFETPEGARLSGHALRFDETSWNGECLALWRGTWWKDKKRVKSLFLWIRPVAPEETLTQAYIPPVDLPNVHSPFIVGGRVTYGDGRPLRSAEIRAYSGMGNGGIATTDDQGRYTLRISQNLPLRTDQSTGKYHIMEQVAIIRIEHNEGFYEKNLMERGSFYLLDEATDPAARVPRYFAALPPDQPHSLNFTFVPAAEVTGRLLDSENEPIQQEDVWIRPVDIPYGPEWLRMAKTDSHGRFRLINVPTYRMRFGVFRYGTRKLPSDDVLDFPEPGKYEVELTYMTDESAGRALKCRLIKAHGGDTE